MKPLTLHRPIHPTLPISVSLRKRTRTGNVLLEVKSPADMVQWIAKALQVFETLGRAMSSELRWAEREKTLARLRQERARLKKRLLDVYLEYRAQGHAHFTAIKLLTVDQRFLEQHSAWHWQPADFRAMLPNAKAASALLKHRASSKGGRYGIGHARRAVRLSSSAVVVSQGKSVQPDR